jgi:ferrous iron transport protein B
MSAPALNYASSTPAPPTGSLTVALAGNPNSGKTTIFNALTGLRQKVANYPGVTVEKKTGRCKLPGARWADVIDLPGTYSLISRSPDEHVAMEVLRGLRPDTRAPDVVVVVVDASNLQRNLYLVSQLIELGRPMVVALNMTDVVERRGLRVSPEALQQELGVPVVPIVGHKRRGIHELKEAILRASVAPMPNWPLPEAMKEELLLVGGGLAILDSAEDAAHVAPPEKQLAPSRNQDDTTLDKPSAPRAWICAGDNSRHLDRYQALAERLLIGDRAGDVSGFATRQPVATLLNGAMTRLQSLGIDPMQADIEAHYRWIDGVTHRVSSAAIIEGTVSSDRGVLPYETPRQPTLTDKVDSVLVHKVWGLLIFATIMAGLFVSMFWLAAPVMDAIDRGVGALGQVVTTKLPDGPLKSLITDGIFAGIGAVVVFVPQIALLFLFLAILEDSGYLARAAFLMDKLLSKVGLHGKSFIPLLSSFACAIPGIMAARTIENRRDRLATIFIAPFMSCSARLPVYALLIGAFFAGYSAFVRGGILLACYLLGILAAVGTAWLFKKSFLKGPPQAFILELPTYKVPQISQVARVVWSNTSKFLTKAGTIIFCLSVILWAMSYYPRLPDAKRRAAADGAMATAMEDYRQRLISGGDGEPAPDEAKVVDDAVASAQSEYSIAGRIGHAMEPAIRPLGYDWKMGVGLVAAFAAREVFVSTLGITYAVGDVEDDTTSLSDAMKSDVYTSGPRAGRPVWTPLVAVSLLVWFVLAMQCMSTLAIVRRETGGWKWPILMLVYMNALAYVASLTVYQVGTLIMKT